MQTPDSIQEHAGKFKEDAWMQYSPEQLGQWVSLLLTRADHRADPAKRAKDLADARNYYDMLGEHISMKERA